MKNNKLLWIVTIIGIFLSVFFFSFYRSKEKAFIRSELNIIGEHCLLTVNDVLQQHFLIIHSVKAFFESSTYVDREEFRTFTRALLEKSRTIHALEWVPEISHEKRAEFEAEHRKHLPGFQITEKAPDGMIKRTPEDVYYPVTYLEPLEGNENALGFDLASNPARRSALTVSKQRDKTVASARVRLVQEKGELFGFLIFDPVHRISGGENEFMGFALGVFRIGDIVEKAIRLRQDLDKKAGILLLDISEPDISELLYRSPGFPGLGKYNFQSVFEVAGRRWKMIVVPTPESLADLKTHTAVIGLCAGLLFTVLIFGYLRSVLNQSDEIRRQVLERTDELNRAKQELEKLIYTIEDGVILIDNQGIIRMFNPSAEKIFQYTAGEVVGKNVNMLMPEPYHSNHDRYIKNYIQTGVSKIIGIGREVRGRRKDGTVFPMYLAISEMRMENSTYFVGSITDITQQKEAEEKLILAKETAEEANRIKSEFMNTMSHELRTPLTIILGNIEELTEADELPDSGEIAEIARDCSKAGEMLMQLINDILDISKIEAGKMVLHKERVLSSELIKDIASITVVLAENKGLELKTDGDEAYINVDVVRMKQALLNLLSNAIKFTDSGSVSIITRAREDAFVITVADTGSGMDEESLTYIFDPFRQVDSSATRKVGGTGLGLAITRKLVELHNGTISVKSKLNQGSSFSIKLPGNT